VIAKIMISRTLFRSSRISHPGAHHAFQDPEPGVRTPKSPHCKGRGFCFTGAAASIGGIPVLRSAESFIFVPSFVPGKFPLPAEVSRVKVRTRIVEKETLTINIFIAMYPLPLRCPASRR
jgi:hypothetical protein